MLSAKGVLRCGGVTAKWGGSGDLKKEGTGGLGGGAGHRKAGAGGLPGRDQCEQRCGGFFHLAMEGWGKAGAGPGQSPERGEQAL